MMLPQSRRPWCVHTGLGGGGWRPRGLAARRANPLRRTLCTKSPRYSCTAGQDKHAHIYTNCHSDIKRFHMRHDMRQWCIHRCTLPRSHMLVRHTRLCKKLPEEHFSIPSLSLNMKKCPFIWLWALWRLYQKNYSWLSVLFIGLWWLPGTFCTPTWEGRKNKPISEVGLKEISESW